MGFKSDIEIAQECEMLPITQIAEKAGIDDKYLEQYGKYKAKLSDELADRVKDNPDGKLNKVAENVWKIRLNIGEVIDILIGYDKISSLTNNLVANNLNANN